NGRQMPLSTVLRNGDEVHVLTASGQTPPAAWERLAVTGRARSAIRRAARDALRRQYSELGRRLLAVRLEKAGVEYSDDKLKKALPRLGQRTVDDALAAIGRSELQVADVLRAVAPEATDPERQQQPASYRPKNRHSHALSQEGWFNLAKVIGLKFRFAGNSNDAGWRPGGLPIRGLRNDIPVSFEEGGAVPG